MPCVSPGDSCAYTRNTPFVARCRHNQTSDAEGYVGCEEYVRVRKDTYEWSPPSKPVQDQFFEQRKRRIEIEFSLSLARVV